MTADVAPGGSGRGRVKGHRDPSLGCGLSGTGSSACSLSSCSRKGSQYHGAQQERRDELELRAWHGLGHRRRAQLTEARVIINFTLTSLNVFGPNCRLL